MSSRQKIIDRIKTVQAIPAATAGIIKAIQDPDVDIAKLTKLIEVDPGLTTNLLKLANSAYFGMPREVKSVKEAAVRLGTNRIFQIVIASAVSPMAKKPIKGYDLPAGELWTHSIAVAIATEKIGKALGVRLPDHSFTAGLLHDIGKVVLGTFIEVDVDSILKVVSDERIGFDAAEQKILGIDHAEVGAILLELWKLPKSLIDVTMYHHRPMEYKKENVVLEMVHLANNICRLSGIGSGMDGLNYVPSNEIGKKYNVKPRITEPVVLETMNSLSEFKNWLNL